MPLDHVPLIHLDAALSGDHAARAAAAAAIDRAVREIGFFVVTGHGIGQPVTDAAFHETRAFFEHPLAEKMLVANTVQGSPRGYLPYGGEALGFTAGEKTPPDLKESFQIGRLAIGEEEQLDARTLQTVFAPNVWPREPTGFEPALRAFYTGLDVLSRELMRLFALALRLPETWFDTKFTAPASVLRSIYYPAQQQPPEPGQLRAGAHTDFGALTLLVADDAPGGLQVRTHTNDWVDVPRVPGGLVVNIGDMMARWTNDVWLSNWHRVVNPPPASGQAHRPMPRQSMAFFANPNVDTVLECIPGCSGPERHPFQGVHYLMSPIIDADGTSKTVVSADFYFVIASGSSSPVRGPGTMLPRQARKQPSSGPRLLKHPERGGPERPARYPATTAIEHRLGKIKASVDQGKAPLLVD